jgi:hypothetical protein
MSEVGHFRTSTLDPRCPLLPPKRTSSDTTAMSVSCQKRKWQGLFDQLNGECPLIIAHYSGMVPKM